MTAIIEQVRSTCILSSLRLISSNSRGFESPLTSRIFKSLLKMDSMLFTLNKIEISAKRKLKF